MGVQGLWELLAPVGRRVSVETLAGKKVAIDASIWLVQFIKAMRDERGEMVRNAHLLGFFRRICKLLFLRTRPVFVFDGGTPALKRRTIAARRRQRENATAKIRKTAEKLLLNHLKAKKLEELAAEIKDGISKDDSKGKHIVSETRDSKGIDHSTFSGLNQEELDEMLAASIAAEEEGIFNSKEATSTSQLRQEEEIDEDECEEIAIPFGSDRLDPTVLASLPPSMQLDLLVQMRERLMAENRQKYQKIKKSPSKFSELQIQSYLKTVAFRRDIDQVQRVAAGKGPEGLQTFRIASEANREFVFSSSFTGNKRKIMPTGGERTLNAVNTESSTGNVSIPENSSGVPSSSDQRSEILNQGASTEDFGPDIETYRDERGRTRVSRVRGLGIQMTRDLQHNLDLILKNDNDNNKNYGSVNCGEAINQHDGNPNEDEDNQSFRVSTMEETPMEVSFSMDVMDGDDEVFSQLVTGKSIVQIPLESCSLGKDTNAHYSVSDSDADWEDGPVEEKSTYKSSKNENDGLDWEDGGPRTRDLDTFISGGLLEEEYEIQEAIKRSLEDFNQPALNETLLHDSPSEKNAIDSSNSPQSNGQRGLREGESEIEAAIKRSLENFNQQSLDATLPQDSSSEKNATDSSPILLQGNHQGGLPEEESKIQEKILRSLEDVNQQSISGTLINGSPRKRDAIDSWAISLRCNSKKGLQEEESEIKEAIKRIHEDFNQKSLNEALLWDSSSEKNAIDSSPISPECDGPTSSQQITQGFDQLVDSPESLPPANARGLVELIRDTDIPEKVLFSQSNDDGVVRSESSIKKTSTTALDGEPDNIPKTVPEDKYKYDSSTRQNMVLQREALGAELGEELSHLRRECRDLGDEQRRLERNAESVNNEMFAECQELLQMFGLPFIIAPMEAESQCAYMEMMNLVDGIVTDDSDAFLFGAQNVYKNIFDDRKYVETYLMKDIENELGLTREKLIHMALLLGSDYTEGVSGIGIVNAIEVVHAFPEEDGLREFREWVESPDPSIFGKLYPHIGDEAKRRLSKTKNAGGDGFGSFEWDEGDGLSGVKKSFMEKHRNVSKNWHIPPSFPSGSVISAYITPQVDGSTDPFSWGKPDLPLLRRLCWEKFGWAHQKADELLVPVLKEYNKHETQLRMEAFYTFNERFAKIRSQRIKRAVKGITGKSSKELMNDSEEGNELKGKRGRKSSSEIEEEKEENPEIKRVQRGKRGRGRGGRRGREAAREIKSVAAEDGGSSDSSDYSPQEGRQVDIASTSSEPRRSTRRKIGIQKETVEVKVSNKESQPSPIQPPIVQEQVDNTAVSSKGDCSYLQGGGGFCVDEDESQLSPGQPGRGAEEEQVNARGFCGVVEEKEEREEIPKWEAVDNREEVGMEEIPSVLVQRDKGEGGFSFTPMASLRRKRR